MTLISEVSTVSLIMAKRILNKKPKQIGYVFFYMRQIQFRVNFCWSFMQFDKMLTSGGRED